MTVTGYDAGITAYADVPAPGIDLPKGGFLDVAHVVDSADTHIGMGVQYYTYLCRMGGLTAAGMCAAEPSINVDAIKKFFGGTRVTALPFAVYAGVVCDLIGGGYEEQARARLAGSEDLLVANAFYQRLAYDVMTGDAVELWKGYFRDTDSVVAAIADLEQYAAQHYAGTPVLHMNRAAATYGFWGGVLEMDPGGRLHTKLGTPVVASGGYPADVMFVTGRIGVWRTAVDTYDVVDPMTNQDYALAERLYAVTTDCLLAYVGQVRYINWIEPTVLKGNDPNANTITIYDQETLGACQSPQIQITDAAGTVTALSGVKWTTGGTPTLTGDYKNLLPGPARVQVLCDGQGIASYPITVEGPAVNVAVATGAGNVTTVTGVDGNSEDMDLPRPANLAVGDLLIVAAVSQDAGAGYAATWSIPGPAQWALIGNAYTAGTVNGGRHMAVFGLFIDSPATLSQVTNPITVLGGNLPAASRRAAAAFRVTGADPAAWNAGRSSFWPQAATSTSITLPSYTPTSAPGALVALHEFNTAGDSAQADSTMPGTDWTKITRVVSESSSPGNPRAATELVLFFRTWDGSTPVPAVTSAVSPPSTGAPAGVQFAIKGA